MELENNGNSGVEEEEQTPSEASKEEVTRSPEATETPQTSSNPNALGGFGTASPVAGPNQEISLYELVVFGMSSNHRVTLARQPAQPEGQIRAAAANRDRHARLAAVLREAQAAVGDFEM